MHRQVSYFCGGTVADFVIPDDLFRDFSRHVNPDLQYDEGELDKGRRVLEAFTTRGEDLGAGAAEIAAACFVWNFFNTNPDDGNVITGNVVIIDLEGDGQHVEYASAADVELVAER